MTQVIKDRLLDYRHAFDDPLMVWAVVLLGVLVLTAGVIIGLLKVSGRLSPAQFKDLWPRYTSWIWLTLIIFIPLLLGAAWVMLAVCLLSLLCYQEYARATGLFREKSISTCVVLGVLVLTFASFDNYGRLFFASSILTVALISMVTIPQDRPKGYIQRVALGSMGFLLFGYSFGYLGLMANYPKYRPVVMLILVSVEMNDIFAYCVGKVLQGPKVIPVTSPGKTIAGTLGALVLTTALVVGLGHVILGGTPVDKIQWLLILGVGISTLGQFGDLLLSSIKRDLGLKDIGTIIPGHGGLLDRFDSLVLVTPAVYHFLSLHMGPLNTLGQVERILTGGN